MKDKGSVSNQKAIGPCSCGYFKDYATTLDDLTNSMSVLEEALGAIMKITKRGQAYDIGKQALAELKGEE